MSEDEYGKRPGSLPEAIHRPRPRLARWVRTLAAIACLVCGVIALLRGAIEGDALWLGAGAGVIVVGAAGVVVAQWMFRRHM